MSRSTVVSTVALLLFGSQWLRCIQTLAAEPTNDEQLLIELVNRARSNPPKYATDFGLSVPLTDATSKPPLALNTALVGSAGFTRKSWPRSTTSTIKAP
jgi:hypothetical protein